MLRYVIAIMSYKRENIICKKTLNYLNEYLPKNNEIKIYLFLSNTDEIKKYKKKINESNLNIKKNINYILSVERYLDKVNFIENYFKEGTNVFCIEDDIKELSELIIINGRKKLKTLTNLNKQIIDGFSKCIDSYDKLTKRESKLFGFYPVYNAFFMNNNITSDLRFIIGSCFGFISSKNPKLKMKSEQKTDYERTILYYLNYGKVIRFNNISALTINYKTEGGLSSMKNRKKKELKSCRYLIKKYPTIVKKRESKGPYCEISLSKKNIQKKQKKL